MKFECPFCEYTSNRKYNLQSHINRKHNIEDVENVNLRASNVNVLQSNVNVLQSGADVLQSNVNVLQKDVNPNVNPEAEGPNVKFENNPIDKMTTRHSCEICGKIFSTRQGKSRHKKNVNCKPPPVVCQPVEPVVTPTQYPVIKHTAESGCVCSYCQKAFSRVDNLKRHLLGCRIKRLTESGSLVLPTNTNATTNNTMTINNNTNCNNTTINNVTNITIHSFDRPCLDHIDGDTVKQMYLGNGRNLKKLIKAGVSRIWKTPENNTFQLPFSDKPKGLPNSEIMKVHCDGEDQYFPAHHVVDVLLHRCATVCESFLRQHYYDESIPGTGVLKHANVLEELAIEFQETWDEDSTFRNEYKPFVRSAILECLQRRKEREEANSNVD